MDIFEHKSWKDFDEAVQEKDLYLFGASKGAEHCLLKIGNKYLIKGILDNDKTKWGTIQNGYEVHNPKCLEEQNLEKIVVLIASNYLAQIAEQLINMNVKYIYSYRLLEELQPTPYPCDSNKVTILKGLLEDRTSYKILDKIIEKRSKGCKDYSDICTLDQYFVDDIFTPEEKEVFVDAGAYNGDTIETFLKWTNNRAERIYAFEPEKEIYMQLLERYSAKDSIVRAFCAGLWKEKGTLSFTSDRECNCISQKGNNTIMVTSIDEEIGKERITMIKMDIEGAELKALAGAKKAIQLHKPKLAICVYHKEDDIFDIPFYIHELVPEYRLYLRHHDIHSGETVIYAKCDK